VNCSHVPAVAETYGRESLRSTLDPLASWTAPHSL